MPVDRGFAHNISLAGYFKLSARKSCALNTSETNCHNSRTLIRIKTEFFVLKEFLCRRKKLMNQRVSELTSERPSRPFRLRALLH